MKKILFAKCVASFLILFVFIGLGLAEALNIAPVVEKLLKGHGEAIEVYQKSKDFRKASDILEKAGVGAILESKPDTLAKGNYVNILNDYAYFLSEQGGRDEDAVRILKKVVSLSPGREVAYLNLGDVFYKEFNKTVNEEKKEIAKEYYKKYIDLIIKNKLKWSDKFTEVVNIVYGKEIQKKYPPYPDVWGYEFPIIDKEKKDVLDVADRFSFIYVAQMPSGDYLITYVNDRFKVINEDGTCCRKKSSREGILFFSGTKIPFSVDEYSKFWKDNKKIRLREITFADGSTVKGGSTCLGKCPLFSGFIGNYNRDGVVLSKKVIVYLSDLPMKKNVNQYTEYNSTLNNDYVITKVAKFASFSLVPLEDDTFLIVEFDGNIIIRLDKNFNTKSDLLNRSIFLIDRDIIDKIEQDLKKQNKINDQTMCDAVYDYVIKVKKSNNK